MKKEKKKDMETLELKVKMDEHKVELHDLFARLETNADSGLTNAQVREMK
jgi:hypothetical protein